MSGVVDGGARPDSRSTVKQCPNPEPHNPHEWINGVYRMDCPGIPLDRVVDGGNPTGAEPYVISDERLVEIRAMQEDGHPAHLADRYMLAGAICDLLAERGERG